MHKLLTRIGRCIAIFSICDRKHAAAEEGEELTTVPTEVVEQTHDLIAHEGIDLSHIPPESWMDVTWVLKKIIQDEADSIVNIDEVEEQACMSSRCWQVLRNESPYVQAQEKVLVPKYRESMRICFGRDGILTIKTPMNTYSGTFQVNSHGLLAVSEEFLKQFHWFEASSNDPEEVEAEGIMRRLCYRTLVTIIHPKLLHLLLQLWCCMMS